MGIIMGLAFAGYIMAVLVPSLALGVLSLKNRNVNQKPRMWAIAFIVMVLILGGLSWYLVYPYHVTRRIWLLAPVTYGFWGWHLAVLLPALLISFLVGQRRPASCGPFCCGRAS